MDGECLRILSSKGMPLEFAVFSPDAAFVVTVARDGLVRSWCSAEGECAQTLVDEGHLVNCAAYSPDAWVPQGTVLLFGNMHETHKCQLQLPS